MTIERKHNFIRKLPECPLSVEVIQPLLGMHDPGTTQAIQSFC